MKLIKYLLSIVFLFGVHAHAFPVETERPEGVEGLERPERPERLEKVERPERPERLERPELPKLEVSDDGQELELKNDQIKVTIEINPADGTVHTSRTRTRNRGGK